MTPSKFLIPMVVAGLLAGRAFALPTDRHEPVVITSEKLEADNVRQSAVYTGDVKLTQGTLQMTGQRLHAQITPKGYKSFRITGKLASFHEVSAVTSGVATHSFGRAQSIVYDEKTETVTLSGDAATWKTRNGRTMNSVKGAKILYNVRTGNARLLGSGAGTSKIILRK